MAPLHVTVRAHVTSSELIRCLKRYIVREIHAALIKDFNIPLQA